MTLSRAIVEVGECRDKGMPRRSLTDYPMRPRLCSQAYGLPLTDSFPVPPRTARRVGGVHGSVGDSLALLGARVEVAAARSQRAVLAVGALGVARSPAVADERDVGFVHLVGP